MNHPIVFVGPSISRSDCESLLIAEFRPPARRGDIYQAALERPSSILLIDGIFENAPAVLHREILYALSLGVEVLGAASMGALRAAELHDFGMIGCGSIYQAYRNGSIDGDDEVALLHGPAELNYLPLSEPLVTIRATLVEAEKAGLLGGHQRDQLLSLFKQQCFKDRKFDSIAFARLAGPEFDQDDLVRWCYDNRVDAKLADARSLLIRVAEGDIPATTKTNFIPTTVWASAVDDWNIYLE